MKLEQINYIIEVAKLSSINKAAKSLLMSQPNLSLSIKSLEDELGFTIFKRLPRGIELTKEGAIFLQHAKSINTSMDSINKLAKKNNTISPINFFISVQYSSTVFYTLVDLIKKYRDAELDFKIQQTDFFSIIDNINHGHCDIGFISIPNTQKFLIDNILKMNGLEFIHLSNTKLCAYMDSSHPLSIKPSVSLSDLLKYPLAHLNISDKYFLYSSFLNQIKFDDFKQKISVDDYCSLLFLLKDLNAITFTFKFDNLTPMPNIESFQGTFKSIDLNEVISCSFGYIKPISSELSPIAEEFLENFKSIL